MGTSKTQIDTDSGPAPANSQAEQQVQSAPEHYHGPVQRNKTHHPPPPLSPQASTGIMPLPQATGAGRARQSGALQRKLGNTRVSRMINGPQTKISVGQPGDRYEQEADDVASRVVSGQKVARISRIALGGQAIPVERQEEEEEMPAQMMPVQRQQPEEEELMQGLPLQRQPEEEEEPLQAMSLQRQPEEEELMQGLPLQRQVEEEEEPLQAMPLQRQPEEEEEPLQAMSLQRQPEEEEEEEELMQGLPLQRQVEEEEEPLQAMSLQRQPEEEEEELMQGLPLQRQVEEEEEPLQAMPLQRQPEEEEEPLQAMSLQRQPEEEEEELMQGLPLQRQVEEEEEPLQAMSLQRQPEEEEEELMQGLPLQRQVEEEEEPLQAMSLQRQLEEEEEEELLQGKALQRQETPEEEEEEVPAQAMPVQRQADELPETDIGEEPWPEPSDTEMQTAETVQAQAGDGEQDSVQDNGMQSRLTSPGGGRPLNDGTKSKMENSLGMDFSGVRVHDNAQNQDDARDLGAKAFAYGNHVWLGKGASENDDKLMAHELTHVVQQGAAVQKAPVDKKQATLPVQRAPQKIQRAGGILGKVAGFARNIPGYHLLSVIIGRDPISGDAVPRTAANVIKGVISLLPGGNLLYENLNKTGAIDKAGAWLDAQIEKLGFTWAYIKGLFSEAWDALSWYDLALPWRAFSKIKKVFTQPIKRLWNFAKSIGSKILEFIFEGAMALAGGFGKQVLGFLKKAGAFFMKIIKDPIGFIGNLVKALGKGFRQFSVNIWSHLKAGVMGWLFGALAGSGLQLPDKLDLKGILSLVMQILGVTYQAIRKRLVKIIGEKRMAKVEQTVSFVADLITRGPIAAWEMITGAIGNLKDMVLGAIKNWVVTKIVKSAVLKLVSMFNPAGAIIQAAMAIYNTVMFFIERAQQIAALVQSIVSSIGRIAAGAVGAAANFIEQTMARTLPVIISFLARLLGLGGIGEKIRGIIKKIQKPIAKGINKVVKFIVGKVKKLFGRGGAKKTAGEDKAKVKGSPLQRLNKGIAELDRKIDSAVKGDGLTQSEIKTLVTSVKSKYSFKVLEVIEDADAIKIHGEVNPKRDKKKSLRALRIKATNPDARLIENPATRFTREMAIAIDNAQTVMNDLYRERAEYGDGSTAFMVMKEQYEGGVGNAPKSLKGGTLHAGKARGYIKGLKPHLANVPAEAKNRIEGEISAMEEALQWADDFRAGNDPAVPRWARTWKAQLGK